MLQSDTPVCQTPAVWAGSVERLAARREHAIPCWSTTQGSAPFQRLLFACQTFSSCRLMLMRRDGRMDSRSQRHAFIGVQCKETKNGHARRKWCLPLSGTLRSTSLLVANRGTLPHSTANGHWARKQI